MDNQQPSRWEDFPSACQDEDIPESTLRDAEYLADRLSRTMDEVFKNEEAREQIMKGIVVDGTTQQ